MTITKWKDLEPKEIVIQERIEYGTTRYYPTNELGKKFADLLGKKTLTLEALHFIIRELGIPVNYKSTNVMDQFLN
jgi:hypothetical protein